MAVKGKMFSAAYCATMSSVFGGYAGYLSALHLRNAVLSFIHERIIGASSMVNGLNVILKLILDIYTTYEIVGNDVEAVGILFCCS